MASANADAVRRFVEALNSGDMDGLLSVLHPEAELHTNRGIEHGREGARRWAMKYFDHLIRHLEIDELIESGDQVVALLKAELLWRETGEVAEESQPGWLFDLLDGQVARWRPYPDRETAMAEATSRIP